MVFAVMAFSSAWTSMLKVSSHTSTNTGVAPNKAITSTVETNVNAGVITSSPLPTPSAKSAAINASVPLPQLITHFEPVYCESCCSNSKTGDP